MIERIGPYLPVKNLVCLPHMVSRYREVRPIVVGRGVELDVVT